VSARRAIGALALAAIVAGCQAATDTLNKVGQTAPGGAGQAATAAAKVSQAAPTIQGAFADMDEPQEIELGRAVSAAVGARYRLLRDPALTRYVALVGNAVAAHSERPDLRYYFAVLDAPEVNAFAAPGGFIFITKGALGVMKDEATLAGVLGHEIAHVARRHALETIKAQNLKGLGVTAVGEVASRSSVKAFSGLISTAADSIADNVILKGHSRGEESEADRLGFTYAAATGYDPAGLRDFLTALIDRGGKDSVIGKFLSTHPGTEDRLKVQEDLLKSSAAGGKRNPERFARAVVTRLAAAPAAGAATPPSRSASASAASPGAPMGTAPSRSTIAAIPPQAQPVPPGPRPTSEFLRAIESTGRYVSYGIQFDIGRERLKPESGATLKMIADAMQADPSIRLQIEGHTDSSGDPAKNVELSRRRAEAVKTALVSRFKIPAERLTTSGVGAARPLDTNDTPSGRAANRRVEFVKQ
jgi:outer membrane protein OmpA-like peptidoglycan-associated protein